MWYNFFGDKMIIDSHCHILSDLYENVDYEIKKAINNGISKIIINGYDIKTSIEAAYLSLQYDEVYASIGIGPQNIDDLPSNYEDEIKKLLNIGKIVAIGEIGLDYYWTKENKEKQIEVFKTMLSIAKENNLPVIVHSRDSIMDTYNLLREYNVRGIMHCYSGSLQMAKEFIKLGFLIGIGGIVTFKNAKKIKEIVKEIPIESISLETDSPYLTPEPLRGTPNNPMNLKYIINQIAAIKGLTSSYVISKTSCNVMSKFDL